MSFPRYPAYKDSGVEWLGEVPKHWNLVPIKRTLQSIEQGWSPQCEAAPAELGEWGVLKVGCVNGGKFNPDENKALPRELLPDARLAIRSGDVLVSRANTRELVGSVAMAEMDYPNILLCDKLYRLRTNQACCPAFLARYLVSDGARNVIETSASGASSSMLNIGQPVIVNMPIALPSAREQANVVHFLDLETAKIDALIAEQQRLIELLQEKCQAVISHAVTKGLNPTAPMKDSGVEWLGEVPEHWDVVPMRRLLLKIEQGWSPECLAKQANEDEWGVVKAGCVNRGTFNPHENKTLPADLKPQTEYEIQAGDLLMSRASGSPELIGSAAFIEKTRPRLLLSDKIFRLRASEKVSCRYLAAMLSSAPLRQQIKRAISGAVGLANNLPQSEIRAFVATLPPLDEQTAIEAFIKKESSRVSDLLQESEAAITLLRERRSALISAAVTGQIDVRGLVPEAAEQ